MARETRAERLEREQREAAVDMAQRAVAYLPRFLNVMAAAVKENFELHDVDPTSKTFTMFDRDSGDYYAVTMQFDVGGQSDWALDKLEMDVDRKMAAREESNRLYKLRQNARSKLTAEELEALGL